MRRLEMEIDRNKGPATQIFFWKLPKRRQLFFKSRHQALETMKIL